jgi:hypothetical protein
MRRVLRENAVCALVACAACATMAWLGLAGFAWSDYEIEALPAFHALVHGHVLAFLQLAPAYGGSLVERAPFALVPGLWGGGELAVYRMVGLPCLLATALLGVWLVASMRSEARPLLARAVTLGVCVANPLTLRALELGHPEELLGACLCVAAVLLAGRDRPLWAGALLGLAIANKEWALLAAGPVLLALEPGRRLRCAASAGAVGAAVLAPLALVGSGGFLASTRASAAPPSTIFQPWQAWWFLGHHGALVHGLFGATKPGYRIAPSWTGALSRPLILAVGLLTTVSLWLRGRDTSSLPRALGRLRAGRGGAQSLQPRQALLALALLLLVRCVLDTWDNAYYPLPFLFALLAWEVRGARERPPILALSVSVLAWASFQLLPAHASPDGSAAFFLGWSLPLVAALAWQLHRAGRSSHGAGRSSHGAAPSRVAWSLPRGSSARAQATTVSALERLVRTSAPSSVRTTMSSMRTPRRPGR